MSASKTVIVKILDKEYQVACPPEQEAGLLQAARQLDQQMRSVRDTGKVIGLERIAVMVALNTTYELMNKPSHPQEATAPADLEQIKRLSERIDDTLQRFSQMEIG